MLRLFALLAATLAAGLLAASAQTLPEAGEGAFSWTALDRDLPDANAIAFLDDGRLAGALEDLWVFDLTTGDWTLTDPPNVVGSADAMIALGGDTLVVGRFLSRTPDAGATWHYACYDDGASCDRLFINDAGAIHEVAQGPYAGRLLAGSTLFSTDRGTSWTTGEVMDFVNDFNMRAFAPLPSGRFLAAGNFGAGYTDDGGQTWYATELYAPYQIGGEGIAAWATPGSVQAFEAGGPEPDCGLADALLCEGAVWIGGGADSGASGTEAWWTNDGGRTWTFGGDLAQVLDGPGGSTAALVAELDRAGAAPDGTAGAGRGLVVLGRGYVYRTLDGGVTWEVVARVAEMGGSKQTKSAVIGPDGRLYVSTPLNGPDDGFLFVTGEPATAALSYVVSASGAPERAELGVRVVPNPSAGGMVAVALAGAGAARAWVVDAVGRRVAELWAGELRGARSVALDVSGWAAGVYTVVVEAEGARRAETLTVVR